MAQLRQEQDGSMLDVLYGTQRFLRDARNIAPDRQHEATRLADAIVEAGCAIERIVRAADLYHRIASAESVWNNAAVASGFSDALGLRQPGSHQESLARARAMLEVEIARSGVSPEETMIQSNGTLPRHLVDEGGLR